MRTYISTVYIVIFIVFCTSIPFALGGNTLGTKVLKTHLFEKSQQGTLSDGDEQSYFSFDIHFSFSFYKFFIHHFNFYNTVLYYY